MEETQESILKTILIPYGILHGLASPFFILKAFAKYKPEATVSCNQIEDSNNLLLTYNSYDYLLIVGVSGYITEIEMC